jgi:hypothetical protein
MKQTAAISAIFIFVNSLSGLAGQLQKGINFSADMYAYVGALWEIMWRIFWLIKTKSELFKIFIGDCFDHRLV